MDTSDADGRVVRVEYYFRGPFTGYGGPALEFLGASNRAPFTLDWRGPALAVREGDEGTLIAFAFDDRGAITSTSDDFPGSEFGRNPFVGIDGAAIDGAIIPGTGGFVPVDDYPGNTAYDGDSVFRHEIEQGIPMVSPDTRPRFSGLYSGIGSYGFGGEAGSFMEWPVFVSQGGTYRLNWRFANERASARPATVSVDGVDVGSVSLRPTGASDFWRFTDLTVQLHAGTNRIRLRTTSPGGGAIDYLTVRPS